MNRFQAADVEARPNQAAVWEETGMECRLPPGALVGDDQLAGDDRARAVKIAALR